MDLKERRQAVLWMLEENEYITAEYASNTLNTSLATIRRDFTYLEKEGAIVKFHGGIKKAPAREPEGTKFDSRLMLNQADKMKIAKAAAELIKDNDLIFIDTSSTTYYIVDFIQASNVQIITHSFSMVAHMLEKGFTPYVIGGMAQPNGFLYGSDTISKISEMRYKKVFLGVSAISTELEPIQ